MASCGPGRAIGLRQISDVVLGVARPPRDTGDRCSLRRHRGTFPRRPSQAVRAGSDFCSPLYRVPSRRDSGAAGPPWTTGSISRVTAWTMLVIPHSSEELSPPSWASTPRSFLSRSSLAQRSRRSLRRCFAYVFIGPTLALPPVALGLKRPRAGRRANKFAKSRTHSAGARFPQCHTVRSVGRDEGAFGAIRASVPTPRGTRNYRGGSRIRR